MFCYLIFNYLLFLGEDIWRYVGKLTGAQKSLIEEKFKYTVST